MMQPSERKEILRKIAAPEEGAKSAIVIQKALAATPYACSSIERLSGGITNFTYRGHLSNTLADGSCSVIIKYNRYLDVAGFVFPDSRGVCFIPMGNIWYDKAEGLTVYTFYGLG